MRKFICLFAALALGGCVSMKNDPASLAALNAHQGQTLTVVTYKKPDFAAMTQSLALETGLFGAVGGAVGASLAISNGNEIIAQNNIADPSLEIGRNLTARLRDALKAAAVKNMADVDTRKTDEATLAALAGKDGVILDVQTVNWQFMYVPFSVHYRVILAMRARLIDATTGTRFAQAPCVYQTEGDNLPTYDEMLADHATRLIAMIAQAKDSCAVTLQKALLGG